MDLFQFRGGVASYSVSDDQAISEILDALGLGMELYVNRKKLDMLKIPQPILSKEIKHWRIEPEILKKLMEMLFMM